MDSLLELFCDVADFSKLFGDKDYLSKALRDELFRTFSIERFTPLRFNMKNVLMLIADCRQPIKTTLRLGTLPALVA